MAAIGNDWPTLLDHAKILDPQGKGIARVVEALTKKNPILQDAVAIQGNLPTGHRTTIRTGLPTLGWRRFNEGILPSKSTSRQVDETCGMLEGFSNVDTALAKLNGNEAAFRASEDRAFIQAMNNEVSSTLFYGNTELDPEKFMGLTPRYDSTTAENGSHVIKVAPSANGNDQASMWGIAWGEDTCHMIYPKGSEVGLQQEDLGKQLIRDAAGKQYVAWVTHWMWSLGLVVRDWRYVLRLCNIDTASTGALTGAGTELIDALVTWYNRIQDLETGRVVLYCNRTVGTLLDKQANNKANIYLQPMDWGGKRVLGFRGIPIRICESLLDNEAVVS